MPKDDVVKHLLFLMTDIGSKPHVSGFQKKFYVMHKLNQRFKLHPSVQEILPDIIRLLVAIDKKQIRIHQTKKSSCFGRFFSKKDDD